jgi:hypothetical protein
MNDQIIPPFVPPMGRDVTDTRNFEKEFTKLAVKDSPPASIVADVNAVAGAGAAGASAASVQVQVRVEKVKDSGTNSPLSASECDTSVKVRAYSLGFLLDRAGCFIGW